MRWKDILPAGISVSDLSLDECRNFKNFNALMESITHDVQGPPGFRMFYQLMHHLLFYGICCIEENKFPALTKCWNELLPLFITNEQDSDWLAYCWIFCDFPLSINDDKTLIDHFATFSMNNAELKNPIRDHLSQFCSIMKASRLGLYQEILSSSKITKFQELFTKNTISTIRSVPYYESGEIFLTRIVSYLGDSFSIHDAKCFPPAFKNHVEGMVRNKMHFITASDDETINYERFMKLAGPYWMSCTHENESIEIIPPDEYKNYHCIAN